MKVRFFFIVLALMITVSLQVDQGSAEPVAIVCSTDNPEGSLHVVALQKFDELVQKYSKGELKALIHYRGNEEYPAIRGEEVNVNMVMSGAGGINVTVVAVGNVSQRAPILNFMTLPYMFPDMESAKRLLQSDYMLKEINGVIAEKEKIRALGWLIGGFRHMTNSKKPVTKIEDIKGLNIRTPKNRLMRDTYKAFGAETDPISWGETFDALKEGRVDGQENPYNVILYSEFWKAGQKYITNNGPFLWAGPILMNEDFYQKLTPEQQDAVNRAALEASMYQWDWIAKKDEGYKQALLDNGMEILDLEDKPKWINATRNLWEGYYSNIGYGDEARGKEVVEKALGVMGQ
ncbi:MAG: TRAP transporter substrate-binding protein [Desulfamplus sp.]|nr:TRAP transporter substrate-binding protein [Desulfamplus sp.]